MSRSSAAHSKAHEWRTEHGSGPSAATDPAAEPRGWCAKDLEMMVRLPIELTLACVLPEADLRRLALAVGRRWNKQTNERTLAQVTAVVGARPLATPLERCVEEGRANGILARLLVLRCWRPGGWRPAARLEGRGHLEAALAAGKGAILWAGPFVFTPLLAKLTLHHAGFAVSHLSRYTHGFSPTGLGVRLLNPLRTRIEERFLAERLVMGPCDGMGAVRRIKRRLSENRIVSIRVLPLGRRTIEAPFLDAVLRVANGAPSLAVGTGAALLPMFTVSEPPGHYATVIEPPLARRPELDDRSAAQDLVAQYAAVLERYALRWPDQLEWFTGIAPSSPPESATRA